MQANGIEGIDGNFSLQKIPSHADAIHSRPQSAPIMLLQAKPSIR